jgi:AraC-like DNA-binding protein
MEPMTMDLLTDILGTLSLKGILYFRTEFSGKWAVTVPTLPAAARFHLVTKGCCHVRIGEDHYQDLHPGDIILVPKGRTHILSDSPQKTAPPLEKVIRQSGYNGNGLLVYGTQSTGQTTQMVCGHFSFRPGADHPVLRHLPEFITLRSEDRKKLPLLDQSLSFIAERVFSESLGSAAAVTRLSEIVFMEILQSAISANDRLSCVLLALQDAKIAKSLQLMHSNPEKQWTVESLACEVAMSRSRFSNRFRKLLGETPMTYLAEWRLQKSLEMLGETKQPIQLVANKTGYQSPSAFTRAFHCKFGISPKEYRSQAMV